jgi:hypothetical protein
MGAHPLFPAAAFLPLVRAELAVAAARITGTPDWDSGLMKTDDWNLYDNESEPV